MKEFILSILYFINQKTSLMIDKIEKNADGPFEGRRKLDPIKNIKELIALGVRVISPGSLTGAKLGDKINPNDIKKMVLSVPILDSKFKQVREDKIVRFSDILVDKCSQDGNHHDAICIVYGRQTQIEYAPAGVVKNVLELMAYNSGSRYILEK